VNKSEKKKSLDFCVYLSPPFKLSSTYPPKDHLNLLLRNRLLRLKLLSPFFLKCSFLQYEDALFWYADSLSLLLVV
jgi:hypothetical protein